VASKPKQHERDDGEVMVDTGALEAISFECECGCRVEIPWSAELSKDKVKAVGKALVCPCCGKAIEGAPKAWRAFDALAWSVGEGRRIRFRLRQPQPLPR
jgi:hypothetical protein